MSVVDLFGAARRAACAPGTTWCDRLRSLITEPGGAMMIGVAAEHLVCADLLASGCKAYQGAQALAYDVIADIDGTLVRVQVKASCFPKNINSGGFNRRLAYSFGVRKRGKHGSQRLDESHCEIVALVAMDIKVIAYLPIALCGETVALVPPGCSLRPGYRGPQTWTKSIDQFPLSAALAGDPEFYKSGSRRITHCPNGHEYTPENTIMVKKASGKESVRCRTCANQQARERGRNKRRQFLVAEAA